MKRYRFYIISIIAISIVAAFIFFYLWNHIGAGVIGKIEKYQIHNSMENVLACIDEINSFNNWPSCEKYSYSINEPGSESEFLFIKIEADNNKYIFMVQLVYSGDNSIDCYLISAASYCSVILNSQKIGLFNRFKYRRIFQDKFLVRCR